MFKVLEHLNFGEYFTDCIRLLYDKPQARVSTNQSIYLAPLLSDVAQGKGALYPAWSLKKKKLERMITWKEFQLKILHTDWSG